MASAVLLAAVAGITLGARSVGGGRAIPRPSPGSGEPSRTQLRAACQSTSTCRQEIRGVHVTMSLASLNGKLQEYLAVPGLNTVELDVKDENGQVGFVAPRRRSPADRRRRPLLRPARRSQLRGRRRLPDRPRRRLRGSRAPEERPGLAIRTRTAASGTTDGGPRLDEPVQQGLWSYNVDVAAAAARAGFDEIQFDYVRFPSDGDISISATPASTPADGEDDPRFRPLRAARLQPLGVRVSADVFGLSATHDLGIGQNPRRISRYVDAVYPMVYPSHYGPASTGSGPERGARPDGRLVAADFRQALGAARRSWSRGCRTSRSAAPTRSPTSRRRSEAARALARAASCSGTRGLYARARAAAASRGPLCTYAFGRRRCAMVRGMAVTRAIELRTEIPGPRSKEILERKERVVADPLSIFLPVVDRRGAARR